MTTVLAMVLAAAMAGQAPLAAPGKLVDIGGRKLHIHCTGSGTPTVVLESGASSFAIDWSLVQPGIAKTTRVCSYDRAGYGWSDDGRVETAQQVVADLRALLAGAGERGPYVLVGASMGGVYVRWFQMQHPADVAGLVYVDASTEDRLFLAVKGEVKPIWAITLDDVQVMYPPGPVPRQPARKPQIGPPFDKLPADVLNARAAFDARLIAAAQAITRDTIVESMNGQVTAFAALHARREREKTPLGSLPVVVLTRGVDSNKDMQAAQAALGAESSNARQTIVDGSGHEIHLFKPDAVLEAVLDVVDAARRHTPIRPRE